MASCFRSRGLAKPLIFCTLCAIADFLLSGVLLIRGRDISTFNQRLQIDEFKFCSSSFDLWILSLVRLCTLLGASFGVLFAKRKMDAVSRINNLKKPWLYCGIAVVVFVVGKFLLSTECSLDSNPKIWLWAFMGWTVGSTVMAYGLWFLLCKLKFIGMSTEQEIGSIQERESLLHVDDFDDSDDRASSDENPTKKEKEGNISAWRLLSYCKPDIPYISLASLFLLLAATGEIFIPYYTGEVIDSIAIEKNKAKFMTSILIMTLISLGTAIATGLRGGLFTLIAARFSKRISNFLFASIVKQEIGFFDNTKTGEVVSRLTSDTTKMSDQVGLNINVFLRNCVQSTGTCVFMFKLSWKLSIVTLIGLPLVAFISEIFGNYFKKLSTQVQEATAKANEIAAEVISSMKTVRSFANEDGEYKHYENKQEAIYRLKMKESYLYGGYRWCTEILTLTLDVVVLLYGGHLVLEGELSGGNLVSFILYQLQLGFYISEIGDIYTGLLEAVGASEKVFELIDRKPKIQNNGIVNPSEVLGEVRFENVSFAYPTRPNILVLDKVSFSVTPGEVIALVGPSGGGKSTCISLLEHFYEPTSGEVLIDSIPVRNFEHKYLHSKVALVGQEPVLFARSIKENIAYGLGNGGNIDQTLVERVSHLANAHSFISDMSEGYDTETGEKGLQLSGGQKQRVAIARALARNPRILLLDEATSALDAESEHLVQDAIYKNLAGHTVLIIAHRLSTIEKADKIVVIDQGRVIAQGKHRELVEQNGLYSKLVKRQILGLEKRNCSSDNTQRLGLTHRDHSDSDGDSSSSDLSSSPRISALSKH
ncbi:ATP-binding cassette sub-family B member 9-like [Orbicella faveolata]|uniref:ATP-binding cassette sub-family B member 9-like n=1 Tax=Orbicella faveolata TaxID=48498 RepID=UPI0009E5519A|nr:ATP-binding cassette sub-family B member 9-like [Orbicella faveolata]XP_020631992.1 ATP-binding cassette sub-family B member 9-like [Orbicella faveolata]